MGEEKRGIAYHWTEILKLIGENPERTGLLETPARVEKMFLEIYRGYDPNQKPKITIFPNNVDGIAYDGMIMDKGYFFSQCEHHAVPFFGNYCFAYIPKNQVLGLSKVARVVDYFSAKLQVQERLTKEIVDCLEEAIEPNGIALVLKARHLCKEMRGVKKIDSEMITSEMRGAFKDNYNTRQEFLRFVNGHA